MRKITTLSLLSAALLASFGAQAADTTELKVIGTIRPAACTPAFTGGGTFDYGTIGSKTLESGKYTKLARKEAPFTITCDAAAKVSLKITDNRSASVVADATGLGANRTFGLGTIDDKKIGGYSAYFAPAGVKGDGAAVASLWSENKGSSWTAYTDATAMRTDHIYSWAATGSTTPAAYKVIAGTIAVDVAINKPEELPLTKDIPLDGSATLEVAYL